MQMDVIRATASEEQEKLVVDNEALAKLNTPISNALSHSLEKKCTKIGNFLNRQRNAGNLGVYLNQLTGFALSSGGLIKDEYRREIWPVLAKNIPMASRHSSRTPSQSSCSNDEPTSVQKDKTEIYNDKPDALFTDISDSDFESALSNISTSGDEDQAGIDGETSTAHSPSPDIPLEELKAHVEWRQVELDVARTLARFPPDIDDAKRETLQEQLTRLIVRILCENSRFHYYQGFHDVCLTFLLVLGATDALQTVRDVCRRGVFYNYLSSTLEESVLCELDNLYVLLFLHDHEVEKRMRDVDLGTLFALSWPLTWFSHAMQEYSQILLFFDFFLCSHQLMPIYVAAAVVCERREEVLACDPEMPYLHKLLNQVPEELNCHRILDTARSLFAKYPPMVLSVLRKEYLLICDRQRRKRSVLEKLDMIQEKQMREQLQMRRNSRSLRHNIYEIVKPFAVCGGAAALALAYYYMQKNHFLV